MSRVFIVFRSHRLIIFVVVVVVFVAAVVDLVGNCGSTVSSVLACRPAGHVFESILKWYFVFKLRAPMLTERLICTRKCS